MFGNLGKKVITDLAIYLARNNLPGLESDLASNAINKFEREISEKGARRVAKGFDLFILKESKNDVTKTIKSFEDSGVLTDRVTETLKHEIKKTWSWIFLILKYIKGREFRREGTECMNKNF